MKLNFYALLRLLHKRVIPVFAGLLLLSNGLLAQSFFTPAPAASIAEARAAVSAVRSKSVFKLNEAAMRSYLSTARMEFKNNGVTIPLEIPLPNGTSETFNMVESPIMEPALATKFPEIKTYTGNGTRDKKSIIRISLTSDGFNAIILNVIGEEVYFEKYSDTQPDLYFNYFGKDATVPAGGIHHNSNCGLLKQEQGFSRGNSALINPFTGRGNSGASLTTYKLALAATGEFTGHHGGTIASSLAVIVGYANRMTAVYRNELSVSFMLVGNNNLLIYTDAANDPYTGTDETIMLDENQTNVDAVVGDGNYDIGHSFSWRADYGSGGGIAASPSLGQSGEKASGASIEGQAPYAQIYFDQLLFHEIGHQFGMSHSYNSSIPVCTTRRQSTSAEPGSGATIMSYGFTCGSDDYLSHPASYTSGPILTFHPVNYDQAITYMASIPGVGVTTFTGNTPPVVTVPVAYTIPKSTPFALTGSATDANNDAMTYNWEGTNVGLAAVPDASVLADVSKPPFFRTYEPSATGATRTYPLLSAILDGSNYAIGDKLPSVTFATTHRLTVRDNNAAGGGVSYGNVTVNIDGSVGPFLETTNLSGTYGGLSAQTITWSVNGTNVATPNVKISFSSDGGHTFPTTLLASTPNDGNEIVVLPNVLTSMGRIKVEAVGNIFFDISNINFTIGTILPITLLSFDATLINKKDALLKWQTTAEVKIKGYEIEMKQGSTAAFKSLGFVNAKGNSTALTNYDFTAPNLTAGTYYFRLKIVDLDGSISYSAVRILTITNSAAIVSMYPTPVKNQLTVVLSADLLHAQLQVVNSIGQVVATNTVQTGNTRLINMDNMSKGMYLLKVWDGSKLITVQKIVKD